ncbi:MAG: hypothetical protein IJ675_07730 [Pseudobutyrivibrio sp.]|nr:hypothetical protein [Pseudobutyrivibrio sp.]
MPIDAGTIGIRPVTQERPTGRPEGVQRREDGGSAGTFRPQTNGALKTAIEDLAGTLSKISAQERFGINKMPSEIRDIVRNILQQSFSMQETLSQGIGSTIESQRFSMEQLSVFARMLSQIGALADKGFSMELSDETQTLLSQFKNLLVSSEGGTSLEPVLMSKAAFELIDSKNPEQLPQALYEILSQLAAQTQTLQMEQPQQEGMQFLKQLIQYFMPRPSTTNSSQKQQQPQTQQQTQQQGQTPQGRQTQQTPTQRFLQSLFKQYNESQPIKYEPPTQQNQQPQNQTQPQQNQQPQNQTLRLMMSFLHL